MFKFWKSKLKNPLAFLSDVVQKMEDSDDFDREKFLRKNIDAIKTAMANDPGAADGFLHSIESLSGDAKTHVESKFGFLDWRITILMELLDETEGFDSTRIPFAAEYFLAATEAEGKDAFETLFSYYPDIAMLGLSPAMLFQKDILAKMETLTLHEDPSLYFKCYDGIDFANDKAKTFEFTNRLSNSTLKALANMLQTNPDKVWFSAPDGQGRPHYLHYLPDGKCRNNFIMDHMEPLIAAVKKVAPTATNIQMQEFENIYLSFSQEERPVELEQLKNLMISERIKMCFRTAADDARGPSDLLKLTLSLDAQPSDLIKTYAAYDDMDVSDDGLLQSRVANPFIPAYEFLRFENPSAPIDAEDKDEGADSRYLWMIRQPQQILVAAFTKADVTAFLAAQTGYVVGEMPTAAEWHERFCYQNNESGTVALEI